MKKTAVLCLLALVAVFSVSLFSSRAADAANGSDFSVIYPTGNYFQIESDTIFCADDSTQVFYFPSAKRIFAVYSGEKFTMNCDKADSLILFGGFVFAKNSVGYEQFDLNAKQSLGQLSLDDAPTDYTLYANGSTLFAVNGDGDCSVYDASLNEIFEYSGKTLEDASLAASNSLLYSLKYSTSNNTFVLKSVDGENLGYESEVLRRDDNFTHLAAANYIYIAFSRAGATALSVYSGEGELLGEKNFNFEIKSMSAADGKLYLLNNPSSALYTYGVTFTANTLNFELQSVLCKSNDDNSHLDSPSDVFVRQNATYIADKNNDRLVTVESDSVDTLAIASPASIAPGANGIYVATENKIAYVENNTVKNIYTLPVSSDILSVATTDGLYALANGKIYVLTDGVFTVFKTAQNALKLSTSQSGNILYVLSADGICAYTDDGKELSAKLSLENIVDFDVDYVGNIYALKSDNTLEEYIRGLADYTKNSETVLTNPDYAVGALKSVSISFDGKLYLCSDQSFVAKFAGMTPVTSQNFVPTASPAISENAEIYAAKANNDTYFLHDPKNYEYVEKLNENSVVMCFPSLSADADFLYVINGTSLGYVAASDLTQADESVPAANAVKTLHPTCKVYQYPLNSSAVPADTLEKNTELEIIGDAAGFSNPLKWYKVRYGENKTGYIVVTDVTDAGEAVLISGSAVYGKAKAPRIGELVSIFALPDSSSSVLDSVADGTELQIIDGDSYADYVKVKYGATVGYVLSTEIETNALTDAQIIAIVLLSVSAAAGIVIFVVTNRLKKKSAI